MRSLPSGLGAAAFAALLCLASPAALAEDAPSIDWPEPDGSLGIGSGFGGSEIVLWTSSRTAGAIDRLTWGGTEFLNAHDHGRELQSATSFDGYGECHNPTEAGSAADGEGERSTSVLTTLRYGRRWLETETRVTWWIGPGGPPANCPRGPGPQTGPLSDHVLRKRVAIGEHGIPNAIAVQVRFELPRAYESATFEALTAYMLAAFTRFWTFEPKSGTLAALSNQAGEQALPVILATPDGSRAMGVWSPDLPQPGMPDAGYGRFDFSDLPDPASATVKWNCVFRKAAPAAGAHDFTCYAVVGTLADVQAGIAALAARPR